MATTSTNKPRQKALVKPGAVQAATGKIKPDQPEAQRRKRTGGGELLKNRKEMSALGGFSVRTLDRLTKARAIPVVRIGRLCFYRPDAVMAALQRNLEVKEVEA